MVTLATASSLATHTLPAPNVDPKMLKTWERFGWTGPESDTRDFTSLLYDYPDFVAFLRTTRLLYTIRGYQYSLDTARGTIDPTMEKIREAISLDQDGHPLLLVNGELTRWEALKDLLQYDSIGERIFSTHNPEEEWNFFAPNGLCQKEKYREIYPIYKLSEKDLNALQLHGETFFQGDIPEALQENRQKWHYIQVFTSDNNDNIVLEKISHVALRLINAEGVVHSSGFGMLHYERSRPDFSSFGNYDAAVTSLDYDEFRSFKKRRVTTIPLTETQYNDAIARMTSYAEMPLRFHRFHQNCTTYAVDVLKTAGHPVDCVSSLPEFILDLGPHMPCITKIKKAVKNFFTWLLPSCVLFCIGLPYYILASITQRISAFCTNSLLLCLGSGKGSDPDPEVDLGDIDNAEGLTYFDRLIKSPCDLFRLEPSMIYSPAKLVHWQLDQASTFIHLDDGSPHFTIVPPSE